MRTHGARESGTGCCDVVLDPSPYPSHLNICEMPLKSNYLVMLLLQSTGAKKKRVFHCVLEKYED